MSLELERLINTTVDSGASDLILKTGSQPAMKQTGKILFLSDERLTPQISRDFLEQIASPVAVKRFDEVGEADFAFDDPERGRFRCNAFRQCGEISMVMRHIKSSVPGFDELHLPSDQFTHLSDQERGLVFITGVTGSGKSTSLASLVSRINDNYNKHIITLEDPIEYLFEDNLCVINQREVGTDTATWISGIRNAMREAPNVIMIGEIRDKDTMEAAIAAAETGHLVLTTLHTVNAIQTVERVMTFFPPHQHDLVRLQLSMVLEGVGSQRLIPCAKDAGMVPAVEMLMATPRVREILREGNTRDLDQALVEGAEYYGTQTFNMSLMSLYEQGLVTMDDALKASDAPDDLRLAMRGVVRGTDHTIFGTV